MSLQSPGAPTRHRPWCDVDSHDGYATCYDSTIATVASLLRRAYVAGLTAGRSEVVDEQPTVQRLRAEIDRRATIAAGLISERTQAESVVDQIVAAAAEIEARFDAAQVSAQGAFERRLQAIEIAAEGAR